MEDGRFFVRRFYIIWYAYVCTYIQYVICGNIMIFNPANKYEKKIAQYNTFNGQVEVT